MNGYLCAEATHQSLTQLWYLKACDPSIIVLPEKAVRLLEI